jgi:hypothetical protein
MNNILGKIVFVSALFLMSGSALFAQTSNAEIFVFSLNDKGEVNVSSGVNISKSPGYDNQPTFGPEGKSVLFTSDRGGNGTDIYEYIFSNQKFDRITNSTDSEYTPRARGKDAITFVREGKGQEMTVWSYDRTSKAETPAFGIKEPVAYYDWNNKGGALVWVRYASMAHFVDTSKKVNLFVVDHVQASTPHNVPGTNKFSFVHRQGNDSLWIKEFDPSTRAVRPLTRTKDSKIDYCWMKDGTIIMGSGSKLYAFNEKIDKGWRLFADLTGAGLKDITRMDVAPDGKRIAIVSNQ